VDPRDIREQLARILASETFANTGRLSRLLRYVVERTLAGEGDQLKEYVLGAEVFDRGDQYDPRLDSIVRVEARRLRSKLDEYYQGAGAADPVLITVPRGAYTPLFEHRTLQPSVAEASAAAATSVAAQPTTRRSLGGLLLVAVLVGAVALMLASVAWRSRAPAPAHTVAVLPFEQHSGSPEDERLASHLTDAVTFELARLQTVGVVSRTSARQFEYARGSLRDMARTLGADFVMEATVSTAEDEITVDGRLVNAAIDRKFWVHTFRGDRRRIGELAKRIAVAISEMLTRNIPPPS
jgi:TolB-like protein